MEHIHIKKIDNKCEISMYGDRDVLSSIVYSTMLNNEKFAFIIIEAAMSYSEKINKEDERARLN
jgi:hypothetical protein